MTPLSVSDFDGRFYRIRSFEAEQPTSEGKDRGREKADDLRSPHPALGLIERWRAGWIEGSAVDTCHVAIQLGNSAAQRHRARFAFGQQSASMGVTNGFRNSDGQPRHPRGRRPPSFGRISARSRFGNAGRLRLRPSYRGSKEILEVRAARPGDSYLCNFVIYASSRFIRSIKIGDIAGHLGGFEIEWKINFTFAIQNTPAHIGYDNIMANRQLVAHISGTMMPVADLELAYNDACGILAAVANAVGFTPTEIGGLA